MGHKQSKTEQHVLIVANTSLESSRKLLTDLVGLLPQHPNCHCYSLVEHKEGNTTVISESDTGTLNKIGLVFVLGENPDLMKAFSLFKCRDSPPIFGIGNTDDYTMPLIYNFSYSHFQEVGPLVLHENNWDNLPCDKLMKLSLAIDCKKIAEATCQIQVHRGMSSGVLVLNLYMESSCEGDKIKIGEFKGDGLLISTPMGSYCKSLSMHGPLMERTMENILITPICPLSMKFRPLCLPSKAHIFIEIDHSCRSQSADIYIDETSCHVQLMKGQLMRLRMSQYKTKMISNLIETGEEYFIRSLTNVLGWGQFYGHVQQLPRRRESLNEEEQ